MQQFNILDFKPIIVNSFFSESELDEIQNTIINKINNNIKEGLDPYYDFEINPGGGCFMYGQDRDDQQFPPKIKDVVQTKLESVLDCEIEDIGLSFLRYSWLTQKKPRLKPHIDSSGNQENAYHRMSFSLPLRNNFSWPISVNKSTYKIDNNDAIIFAVTADLHRRPYRKFNPEEIYDVFIVRFTIKNQKISIKESKYEDIEKSLQVLKQIERYERKETGVPNGI